MKTIYDFSKEELLSNLMNKEDVKHYLKNGNFSIYTFYDYIGILVANGLLEEELNGRTVEEHRHGVQSVGIKGQRAQRVGAIEHCGEDAAQEAQPPALPLATG